MMKRNQLHHLFLFVLLLSLGSACAPRAAVNGPTPFPPEYFPTVVVLTGEAVMATSLASTPSLVPSKTFVPSLTPIPSDTLTPAATITPSPSPSAPNAQIRIETPGPMSKVTSPLSLRMQVVSGGSELVQIDLQGEDGRLLARKLQRVPSWPGGYYVSLKIPFEVRTAAEVGLITISTKDDFGRPQAQLGRRVLLLSIGTDEITPEGDSSERAVFYNPTRKDAIAEDGVVNIDGRILPFNDKPVVLELIDPDGKTVGLRVLDFEGTNEQLFTTTIPYSVSESTMARLILRQDDDRLDGYIYLYSQEITLNP